MKKILPLALFVLAFIAAYMILCFAIGGFRIKLDAPPFEYFMASISHMMFFKALVSFVFAIIVGVVSFVLIRKK